MLAQENIKDISIDEVSKRFEAHLATKGNYRIIFSGRYGTGKSYFLENFFESKKEKYNKFTLSPVNYVVSANEDIFELIKVDIIRKLFFDGFINFEKSPKKNKTDVAWQMIHEKPFTTVKHIVEILKKVKPYWETTSSVLTGITQLKMEFEKYEEELTGNLKLNTEHLADFVNNFVETPGNIFEENFVTKTINNKLTQITNGDKKENILIIDDLDRIDPEHIFRILNVLSAHNNYWDERNKFKFHQIILVCDIENIRQIFHHRYGEGVDFSGYIDKFFSTEIFSFSNNDALKQHVERNVGNALSQAAKGLLVYLLLTAIERKQLTLRKIIKSNFTAPELNFELGKIDFHGNPDNPFLASSVSVSLSSKELEILKVIKVLSTIWGDFQQLKHDYKAIHGGGRVKFVDHKQLIDFLVLPLHFAQKFGQNELLFLKQEDFDGYKKVVKYDYPVQNICGVWYKIQTQWLAGNRYSGQGSYFSNFSVYLREEFNGTKQTDISTYTIEQGQIFEALSQILTSFEKFKFLNNLGI